MRYGQFSGNNFGEVVSNSCRELLGFEIELLDDIAASDPANLKIWEEDRKKWLDDNAIPKPRKD